MSISSGAHTSDVATRRGRRGLWIALAILLALLVVVGGVGLFGAPQLCTLTNSNRHGLACDIPLPSNAHFVRQQADPSAPAPTQRWFYLVSGSSIHAVADLYARQLPDRGWRCVDVVNTQAPGVPQVEASVTAIDGNRGIGVGAQRPPNTIPNAHPADVLLVIGVTTFATVAGRAPADSRRLSTLAVQFRT